MAADPMESLRLPDEPESPREAFRNTLRARIESALGIEPQRGTTVAETLQDMQTVTPYITCKGAADAIAFYVDVLGAVEVGERIIDQSDGRVGHAVFMLGDSRVMISDEYPEVGVLSPTTIGGTAIALNTYVADTDTTYARALAAGARGLREPADQFYGSRSATILDPWGHRWFLESVVHDRELPKLEGFDVVPVAPAPPGPAAAPPPPSGVAPLGYFTLRVDDVERAGAFYGALFGWQVEPSGHISNIDPPGGFASGMEEAIVLYIEVPDLVAASARVVELGGTVLSTASYESGGNARCTDDQGTRFDLHQPNPGYERR